MSLRLRKAVFLSLMAVSYLPIVFFLDYTYLVDAVSATKFIATACGMIGVVMLTWQYLMGVRGLVSKFVPDLIWVNSVHKKFGIYGFILITMHPVFMTFYYFSAGINFFIPTFETNFDKFRLVGELAYTVLAFTWFTSALIRNRISFRWWKRIHLFNYTILPLVLFHSLNIGTRLTTTDLKYYWYFIATVFVLILIYRFILFKHFGFNRQAYTVTAVHQVLDDVVQIDMAPSGKGFEPQPGQFIYFHPLDNRETHPFTASRYNPVTREISISPKASGQFSDAIQHTQAYAKVWLDGPYGVFTKEAYTTGRPLVLIAGGIGITPFIRLIEKLQQGWQKQVILFYANRNELEVAYVELLDEVAATNPNFKVVHVMSRQSEYMGEKGYVDTEKIARYLDEHIQDYEYFLCGPPPMMKSLTAQLRAAGIRKAQIHSERFSL